MTTRATWNSNTKILRVRRCGVTNGDLLRLGKPREQEVGQFDTEAAARQYLLANFPEVAPTEVYVEPRPPVVLSEQEKRDMKVRHQKFAAEMRTEADDAAQDRATERDWMGNLNPYRHE